MALTNAEKQARWRERNVVVLTGTATEIAERLIEMGDQAKLRDVVRFLKDHLKHPDRTWEERMLAMGVMRMDGFNGRLTPKQAIGEVARAKNAEPQTFSWGVEAIGKDSQRYRNGARFKTRDEAEVYVGYAAHEIPGYVTGEVIRYDDPPTNSITRRKKGGRPTLTFVDGTCVLLEWQEVPPEEAAAAVPPPRRKRELRNSRRG